MAADIRGGRLCGSLGAGRVQFWFPPCGKVSRSLCLTFSHILQCVSTLVCILLAACVRRASEPVVTSRAGGMCTRAASRASAAERASQQGLQSGTASKLSTTMLTRKWRWMCQRIGVLLRVDNSLLCNSGCRLAFTLHGHRINISSWHDDLQCR